MAPLARVAQHVAPRPLPVWRWRWPVGLWRRWGWPAGLLLCFQADPCHEVVVSTGDCDDMAVARSCGVGWGGEERVWGGAVRSVWWWWVLCQVPLRPLGRCTALLSAVPQAAYIIGAAAPGTVGVLMLSLCLAGSAREYLGAFRILRRGPPFRGARAARSYLGAFRIVRRGPPFRCALSGVRRVCCELRGGETAPRVRRFSGLRPVYF